MGRGEKVEVALAAEEDVGGFGGGGPGFVAVAAGLGKDRGVEGIVPGEDSGNGGGHVWGLEEE